MGVLHHHLAAKETPLRQEDARRLGRPLQNVGYPGLDQRRTKAAETAIGVFGTFINFSDVSNLDRDVGTGRGRISHHRTAFGLYR